MAIWQVLLLSMTSAAVGGVIVFVCIHNLFLKQRKHLIQLTDEKMTEEIVNLKASIRLVYSIGPILAILLAILGVKGWEDAKGFIGTGELEDATNNYGRLNSRVGGLIQRLEQYQDLASKQDLDDYLTVNAFNIKTASYISDTSLESKLRDKVTSEQLTAAIGNYLKTEDFNATISSYEKTADVDNTPVWPSTPL